MDELVMGRMGDRASERIVDEASGRTGEWATGRTPSGWTPLVNGRTGDQHLLSLCHSRAGGNPVIFLMHFSPKGQAHLLCVLCASYVTYVLKIFSNT